MGYLFRRIASSFSPWVSTQSGTPRDAGLAQPIISSPLPDRARGAMRAAVVAYTALVSPIPREFVTPQPVPSSVPLSAPRAQLAGREAYHAQLVPPPPDSGTTNIPPYYPDHMWAPLRAAPKAYEAVFVPAPLGGDVPIVQANMPDRVPARARAAWYWTTTDPLDKEGIPLPGLPSLPKQTPAPRRAAWQQSIFPGPLDTTAEIVAASYPHHAYGRRPGLNPLFVFPPLDQGIPAPIVVVTPDRAPGPRWASWYPGGSPKSADALVNQPVVVSAPTQAPGPRRAAWSSFATGTPPDQGTAAPVVPSMPDRARGAARAALYPPGSIPPHENTAIGPVVEVWPTRAPGPQRSAQTSYTALVSATPVDYGVPPMFFVDPDLATLVPGADIGESEADPDLATLIITADPSIVQADPDLATLIKAADPNLAEVDPNEGDLVTE
jgi:hypothetical protein